MHGLSISYRTIFIALVFALYAYAMTFGLSALSSTAGLDAGTVARLAQTIADGRIEGSYEAMAFLYARTTPALRIVIEIALGTGFILTCMGRIHRPQWLAVLALLLISPILFFLTQFVKDTILVAFVLAAVVVLRTRWPEWLKIALVCVIYAAYAMMFRQYYYLIVVAFIGLCLLRTLPAPLQLAAIAIGLVALAFVPAEIFAKLQTARDAVNINRIGRDLPGSKTAFMNLVQPGGYGEFLINYGYATARLHLPFLFGAFRLQEAFLLVNLAAYATFAWVGLRSRLRLVQTPALLFLAHVAILMLFEPDLGSYLRHLSSALPYLVPAVMLLDQGRWRDTHRP